MLKKDYKKLYQLQDKFLKWWETLNLPFYLTGGTALGRFYLKHRFSEDLDFFVNNDSNYKEYIKEFAEELTSQFQIDNAKTAVYDDFSRFYISENNIDLKLEFVNDVKFHSGELKSIYFGNIDTPDNILSNKITAILNREEPKDIVDIIHISLSYNFNWTEIFMAAKNKTIINEIDVEQKLKSFPIVWLKNVNWLIEKKSIGFYKSCKDTISDDFMTGKDNSICKTNISIFDALPISMNNEKNGKREK